MSELFPEQLLYLLYALAYSVEGTVTKGAVKNCLSKKLGRMLMRSMMLYLSKS